MRLPTVCRQTPAILIPVSVFLLTGAWFYLPDILFSAPRGIHFIRQTDSISFLMNYGRPSWSLLDPAVYSLREAPVNGRAAAEFPVLYYLLALARNTIGVPYQALRSVNLGFVLFGHVVLARTASRWLGSMIAGTGFSLWMFSSSVVVYYAANYLPDAAAYGSALAGMCILTDRLEAPPSRRAVGTGLALLTLAGLLKAPAGLYLLSALGVVVLQAMAPRKKPDRFTLLTGLFGVLLCVLWHGYAILYNKAYDTHYFMTWSEPIWEMSPAQVRSTFGLITDYWWTKYHHPTTWHVLLGLFASCILLLRRLPSRSGYWLLFLIAALAGYVALFFRKFSDHDYYMLTIAPIFIFIALWGLCGLRSLAPHRWGMPILSIAMPGLAIMGLLLALQNLERRYAAADAFTASTVLENRGQAVLQAHAIPLTERMLVIGDPTPDGALLFLNRKGWAYGPKEQVPLDSLVALGAGAVVVLDPSDPKLPGYHVVAQENGWRLFLHDGNNR